MPHLTIEISANLRQPLAQSGLLAAAHHALLDSGVFDGLGRQEPARVAR